MTQNKDVLHFVNLRQELTEMRLKMATQGAPLSDLDRDYVALAQAEALCDIAATLNAGISVATD
jgi:hypothetical protein